MILKLNRVKEVLGRREKRLSTSITREWKLKTIFLGMMSPCRTFQMLAWLELATRPLYLNSWIVVVGFCTQKVDALYTTRLSTSREKKVTTCDHQMNVLIAKYRSELERKVLLCFLILHLRTITDIVLWFLDHLWNFSGLWPFLFENQSKFWAFYINLTWIPLVICCCSLLPQDTQWRLFF